MAHVEPGDAHDEHEGGRKPTHWFNCVVCGQKLGLNGGYAETGMCGPCATGEAATIEDRGKTW